MHKSSALQQKKTLAWRMSKKNIGLSIKVLQKEFSVQYSLRFLLKRVFCGLPKNSHKNLFPRHQQWFFASFCHCAKWNKCLSFDMGIMQLTTSSGLWPFFLRSMLTVSLLLPNQIKMPSLPVMAKGLKIRAEMLILSFCPLLSILLFIWEMERFP